MSVFWAFSHDNVFLYRVSPPAYMSTFANYHSVEMRLHDLYQQASLPRPYEDSVLVNTAATCWLRFTWFAHMIGSWWTLSIVRIGAKQAITCAFFLSSHIHTHTWCTCITLVSALYSAGIYHCPFIFCPQIKWRWGQCSDDITYQEEPSDLYD